MRWPGGEVPSTIGYILEWMKKYGPLIERAFSSGRLRQDAGGGGVVGPLQTHTHDGTTQGGDLWTKGADLPSAATLAVGVAGHYFHVTGTTTITAIASRPAGVELILEFDGALTITHGASLVLANATNIVTVAGDVLRFTSEGGGTWRQSTAKQTASSPSPPGLGPVAGQIDIGDAASDGVSASASHADHQHPFPAPAVGYPVDVGTSEADGTATTPARSDHAHAHGAIASGDLHAEYQTPAEHTAVGDSAPHHAQAHNILSVDHADSLAAAVSRGLIIVGNATPKWAGLAIPSLAGALFHFDGLDPKWADFATHLASYVSGILTVEKDGGPIVRARGYGAAANAGLHIGRARGTIAAPSDVLAEDIIGEFAWYGYQSGFKRGPYIDAITTEAWTATARGSRLEFFTVPNGSALSQLAFTIEQNQDLTLAQNIGMAAGKTVDGVDVSGHASRHTHGGADEVATATPGANAIPKAGAGGKLAAGWVQEVLAYADLTDDPVGDHLGDAVDAHDASAISNVPAGSVAATTVQAAIDELATDYAAADSAHTGAADPHTGYTLSTELVTHEGSATAHPDHTDAAHTGKIGEVPWGPLRLVLKKALPAATNNATLDDDWVYKGPWTNEAVRINNWYIRFESNLAANATFELRKNGTAITGSSITVNSGSRDAAVDAFTETTLADGDSLEAWQTAGNAENIGGSAYVYGDQDVVAAVAY